MYSGFRYNNPFTHKHPSGFVDVPLSYDLLMFLMPRLSLRLRVSVRDRVSGKN